MRDPAEEGMEGLMPAELMQGTSLFGSSGLDVEEEKEHV